MRISICLSAILMVLVSLWIPEPSQTADGESYSIYFDLVVDEPRQRLYGSYLGGESIDVLSLSNLEVISTITVGSVPAGIDLSPDGKELAVALYGQGEIAFVDLQTLMVTARVTPEVTIGPNRPYDVLYGRPGRLYSVSSPESGGFDYVHVIDTTTKLEVGHSTEIMRAAPHLAMTDDKETLYVSQVTFNPQQIYRFDITTDTPSQNAMAPHGPVAVNTLCVVPDGRVFTSGGQILSADLSEILQSFSASGSGIECGKSQSRVYVSSNDTIIGVDAVSGGRLYGIRLGDAVGAARLNAAETVLFVSTNEGVKAFKTDYGPRGYLPVINRPKPGLIGRVTLNGAPVSEILLQLRFYDAGYWYTYWATDTDAEGNFQFNTPSLSPGQIYYIRYQNTADIPGRLWTWGTREITTFTAGETVEIDNFDIADIPLAAPEPGALVSLPFTFQWGRRLASPTDSYEYNLYDYSDGSPYFYTDPPLGYVDCFVLNRIPAGFSTNTPYAWDMWVYSPDGGFGISRESWVVGFSNHGMVAPEPGPSFRPLAQSDADALRRSDLIESRRIVSPAGR